EIEHALADQHASLEEVERTEHARELKAGRKVLGTLESDCRGAELFVGGDNRAAHIRQQPGERAALGGARAPFAVRCADDAKVERETPPNRFVQVERQRL